MPIPIQSVFVGLDRTIKADNPISGTQQEPTMDLGGYVDTLKWLFGADSGSNNSRRNSGCSGCGGGAVQGSGPSSAAFESPTTTQVVYRGITVNPASAVKVLLHFDV